MMALNTLMSTACVDSFPFSSNAGNTNPMDVQTGIEMRRPSQTKIVATLGPSVDGTEKLVELVAAGADVFRLNAAHGDQREYARRVAQVREASERTNTPIAVLMDLAGPKIRLGELPGGQYHCVAGEQLRFIRGETPSGVPGEFTTTYAPLVDELAVGDKIVLADGTVTLIVEDVGDNAVGCRITQSGLIRSRQGVNLPGVKLSVPTIGPNDRENAIWAARNGIDFLGLSFTRSPQDVLQLKAILEEEGAHTQVIAKIEKPEALDQIEQIVREADGIMVARGDLGVEIDIAEIVVAQKRIIELCHRYNKPVIIATQMLDSMQHSRIPTRAEVADTSNAVLDGADACMLSGETAAGEYPRESVEMMHRIALATERLFKQRSRNHVAVEAAGVSSGDFEEITEVTAKSAAAMADELGAKMIVVATASGKTALCVSKNRRCVPTVGVSNSEVTLRRMCLYWGVVPVAGVPTHDHAALLDVVVEKARTAGFLTHGDRIVLMGGTGLQRTRHNVIVVHELE